MYHIDALKNETLGEHWYFPVGLVLCIFLYNPVVGFFLRCPQCRGSLKMQPHVEDKHSKADCFKCNITWDLGVAFKTSCDDSDHYDD